MNLYDFMTTIVDKRLPVFSGAGIKREGGPAFFGRGRGKWFLSQCLSGQKKNGKLIINNTPYMEEK